MRRCSMWRSTAAGWSTWPSLVRSARVNAATLYQPDGHAVLDRILAIRPAVAMLCYC